MLQSSTTKVTTKLEMFSTLFKYFDKRLLKYIYDFINKFSRGLVAYNQIF